MFEPRGSHRTLKVKPITMSEYEEERKAKQAIADAVARQHDADSK